MPKELNTWKFRDIRSSTLRACALMVALCLAPEHARASDCADVEAINVPGAKLQQFYRDCRNQFIEPLKNSGKGVSFERLEPETQCRLNLEAGHNRTGYRPDFSVALSIPGVDEPQFNASSTASKDGACQYTWTAMKTAYCGLKKRRQLACNATAQQLQNFSRCLEDDSAQKCYENFQSILAQYDSLGAQTQGDLSNAAKYVNHLKSNNEQVLAKYQQDATSLQRQIPPNERSQPSLNGVAAEKGGFTQIGDYRQHLIGAAARGPLQGALPVEQRKALETANSFVSAVNDINAKQAEWLKRVSQTYRNKSPDKDKKENGSALATAGQLAGPAAGVGQSLMGGGTAATSASGALPLAAAALAGAGALSGSTGGSGAKGSAFGDAATAAGASTAATAAAGANAPAAEKFASANNAPGGAPAAFTVAKASDNETPFTKTASNTAGADANLGSSTGASLQGKMGARTAGRKVSSVEAAGGNDMLTPFAGDLNSTPAPKHAGTAASAGGGGEISNLLGQMKNLFNFDDPLANAPASGVFAGTHPAGENFENYGGGEETYSGEHYADAAGEEYGYEGGAGAQGSPFGTINVSLFERVQARHRLCQKRGLVMRKMEELSQ